MALLNRWARQAVPLLLMVLSGCSNNVSAPINNAWNNVDTTQIHHIVQPGETIYSIAWRYNLNDEELAKWNQLKKPYGIHPGQTLCLTVPPVEEKTNTIAPALSFTPITQPVVSPTQSSTTATPVAQKSNSNSPGWPWPVKGKIIEHYGQNNGKGIDIAVPLNTKVKAVQDGTVVYSGANLHGYGQLIIIKQKNDLMTAYAHNSKLLVSEGNQVKTGQTIALSGNSEASEPMLHFEVRKAGKPVDPMIYMGE